MTDHIGVVEIDGVELHQREITLAILGRADFAVHRVAGAQAEAADLVRRNIDVVGTGQEVGFRAAQETKAIGQHFDRAFTHDLLAIFRLGLEDREHQILLAQGRRTLDTQFLGKLHEVGGRCFLKVLEMHCESVR